jgi:hypothetical protein
MNWRRKYTSFNNTNYFPSLKFIYFPMEFSSSKLAEIFMKIILKTFLFVTLNHEFEEESLWGEISFSSDVKLTGTLQTVVKPQISNISRWKPQNFIYWKKLVVYTQINGPPNLLCWRENYVSYFPSICRLFYHHIIRNLLPFVATVLFCVYEKYELSIEIFLFYEEHKTRKVNS